MELFRALAVLAEPPGRPEAARLAGLLGLGGPPSPSEYTETFVFQLYPYASVYLGAEGMLGGEARDRVAGFLGALGRTPPHEPDHLAFMLATYAELSAPGVRATRGGAGATRDEVEEGGDEALGRRREAARSARSAFLWEHMLSWMPAYLDRLADIAPPFYRRWGGMLLAALLEEAEAAGPPATLALHLREAPAMSDPRSSSADEFLQTLLAPARSGIILTRTDLARASRSLGVGLRAGERKFALKSLLGQDAAGALAWLAGEASRQAARHARHGGALAHTAAWWAARSESTASLLQELKADAGSREAEARP